MTGLRSASSFHGIEEDYKVLVCLCACLCGTSGLPVLCPRALRLAVFCTVFQYINDEFSKDPVIYTVLC